MKKLLTLLLISSMLFACSTNKQEETETESNDQTQTEETNETYDVVNAYLEEKRQSIKESFLTDKEDENANFDGIAAVEEMLGDYQTELSNEVIDGDSATVDVTVKTYDMGNLISEYITDSISKALELSLEDENADYESAIAEILQEKIDNCKANGKTYTQTITITLHKEDGTWTVDESDTLDDALSGGINAAMEEINSTISDSTTSE